MSYRPLAVFCVKLGLATGFALGMGHSLHAFAQTLPLPPPGDPQYLIKLGEDRLVLSDASTRLGNTLLMQGSLAVHADQALGLPSNFLDMAEGTRLELAGGVTMAQGIHVQTLDSMADLLPPGSGITLPPASSAPTTLFVAEGTATHSGEFRAQSPIVKDGVGTWRHLGNAFMTGHPLQLRQGGLQVGEISLDQGHLWLGDIHALQGTTLSGIGLISQASVAGRLQPGDPQHLGPLMFADHLQLADTAQTRIRIGADGQADQLWSLGTARLAGELLVVPAPGTWQPASSHWDIVLAEQGLDDAALTTTPVGPSTSGGRFAQVRSTLSYLSPILSYSPQAVTLRFAYNRGGLNSADASWRSALLDDSRFMRESALMHAASGHAWAQSWGASTQRQGAGGLPGDDRDTSGLQVGLSRPWGRSAHWLLFAGVQDSLQRSTGQGQATGTPSQPWSGPYRVRDRAVHLGLGAHHAGNRLRVSVGLAQARHRARLSRRAGPNEPALNSRPHATLTQAWLDARPTQAVPLGNWAITPWVRGTWLHLRRPATQETGASLAAVNLAAQTDRRWLTQLGVQAQRAWDGPAGEAVMAAELSVRSLWGGRALSSPQAYRADPGQRFDVQGLPNARHVVQLDVGVQAPITSRAVVTLAYTGQTGGGQLQHGAWLGVRVVLDGKLRGK